jgi:hypothetical protein
MPDLETRIRMTLDEAGKCLKNYPADGIHYIVANEDGSFSIVGKKLSNSEKLADSFYDTVVVATSKKTKRGDFFDLLQQAAAEPITLQKLIQHLIGTYRPPRSKRDPEIVIRVRTKDAYTTLGYLQQA